MLIRIIRTLYPHWGAYSGAHQFVRYLNQGAYSVDMQVVSDSDDDFALNGQALRDFLRYFVQEEGMQWYKLSDLMIEMRTLLQRWPHGELLRPSIRDDSGYGERMQLALLMSMILDGVEVPATNIDVIHYLDGEHSAQFIPKLYRQSTSRPRLIATYHQHPELLPSLVKREIIANLDCVTLVSPEQAPFFEEVLPKERIKVILLGIDTTYFYPDFWTKTEDETAFKCITVGHYQRDYNVVRQVAQELSQHENIEFQIVTSRTTGAEDLPNVRIYRDIDDATLRTLYQQADILFLPLLQSTANNALVEGMACGLPVVSSDLLSVRAYVPNQDAILIKGNEPKQFADAILRLIHDKYKRRAMAVASRKRAEELDWRNIVMQYEDLYTEVAQQ